MTDWIELHDLTVDAIVGVLESEQRNLQPVVVDLAMGLDLDAASAGDLSMSVDYASVQEAVLFLAQHGRWRLIESFATAVARYVLAPPPPAAAHAAVDVVRVKVRKPTILDRAVPGVSIERTSEWCDLSTRMVPEKTWLDTLCVTELTGAYRAHVEPGGGWTVPVGLAALVLAGSVEVEGKVLGRGDRIARLGATEVHAQGTRPATLLLVGQPPVEGGIG